MAAKKTGKPAKTAAPKKKPAMKVVKATKTPGATKTGRKTNEVVQQDEVAGKPVEQVLIEWARRGASGFQDRIQHHFLPLIEGDRSSVDLARAYASGRMMLEAMNGALGTLSEAVSLLGGTLVPEALERDKVTSHTIESPDGVDGVKYRITVSTALRASIRKDGALDVFVATFGNASKRFLREKDAKAWLDREGEGATSIERVTLAGKDAAFEWLRLSDMGSLIVETVNASTLSATGKAMLQDGKELPETVFNTFYQPSTSLTKV